MSAPGEWAITPPTEPADETHPDCPHGDPFHDHGDGCPSCDTAFCGGCSCVFSAAEAECPNCGRKTP